MLPLYDMMMQAQQGEAAKAWARQFGMDEDQVTRAMEALMPAFSTGLKRSTSTPQGFGNFMQTLATGEYARYFDNLTEAFSPQGVREGNTVLSYLFGSDELRQAVARQAAQATGIAQEIYRQMMPPLAASMMGGMFKQSTAGGTGNPFADMMAQMMGQTGAAKPVGIDAANPFGQMMETMFGSGKVDSAAANPFAEMLETMMKMGFPGAAGGKGTDDTLNPYQKLFGDMFEAGVKVQKDYQESMERVFDSYWKGIGRPDQPEAD